MKLYRVLLGILTAFFMHGLPVIFGLAAYLLITAGGNILTGFFTGMGWLALFCGVFAWWRELKRWGLL